MRITITVQTEDAIGTYRSGSIPREYAQEKWFAENYLLPSFRAALEEADRATANKTAFQTLKREAASEPPKP